MKRAEKINHILDCFSDHVGKSEIRIFEYASKANRDNHSVLEFKDIIVSEYRRYFGNNVEVYVFKTFYVLIGKVSSKDLRIVGKRICHYYGTGQLCKAYGNSTQLFHCIKTVQANAKR